MQNNFAIYFIYMCACVCMRIYTYNALSHYSYTTIASIIKDSREHIVKGDICTLAQ